MGGLAQKMQKIWESTEKCRKMCKKVKKSRKKVLTLASMCAIIEKVQASRRCDLYR